MGIGIRLLMGMGGGKPGSRKQGAYPAKRKWACTEGMDRR